jgi:hypothetical protein
MFGMSRKEKHVQKGWQGLNSYLHDTLIRDDQFSDCNNVQPDTADRSWKKRLGYANIAGTTQIESSKEVLGLYQVKTPQELSIFNNTNQSIYKQTTSTAYTARASSLSPTKNSVFKQWNNKVFFANGADNIKRAKLKPTTNIYVADDINDKILEFNNALEEINSIGGTGTGNNQYDEPIDLCVTEDFIFVVDKDNTRIIKLDKTNMSYLAEAGTYDGITWSNPQGITTDGTNVFVMDSSNNRVVKLDLDLGYVAKIGSSGSGNDQFSIPTGISTDGINLYIADTQNNRVHKRLNSNLSYVDEITLTASGEFPRDTETTRDYLLVTVTDSNDSGNITVQRYNLSDLSLKDESGNISTATDTTVWITADENNYYVTIDSDDSNQEIWKYDLNHVFIQKTSTGLQSYVGLSTYTNAAGFTEDFYDICTPFRPVALDTGTAGNVNGTILYRTSWYNPISELETTVGLPSSSLSISTNIAEVVLDFRDASFLSKTRADAIGVTHHRIYRKDGSASYKLQGTYPIYWIGSAGIDANQETLTVLDSKGMFDPNLRIVGDEPYFYIQWDDEVIKVTDIARTDDLGGGSGITAGDVDVTAGSNTITSDNASTDWSSVIKGDTFVGPDSVEYEIEAVVVPDSGTREIRLTTLYGGSTAGNQAYRIARWQYTTWTILRAQKGTEAANHTLTQSTIYLYSIEDNTDGVSNREDIPSVNDYAPRAKHIGNFQGRFLMANSQSNPSRFWWSDVADEDIVREDSFIDVKAGDDDEITGFTDFGRGIVIFKQDSIWYLSGDLSSDSPNMALEQVANDKGCISAKTIKKTPYGIVFFDERGVWLMQSLTSIKEISKNIKDHIDDDLNHNYTQYAVAEYFSPTKEYLLSVPNGSSQTTNNQMLVMNMQLSDYNKTDENKNFTFVSWYYYDIVAASIAVIEDSNGDDQLYIGDYNGYIFQMYKASTWTDDDGAGNLSAITAFAELKNYNFSFDNHKKFKNITPTFEETGISGSTMTLSYKVDNGTYKTYPIPISGTNGTRNYKSVSPQHMSGERLKIKFNNDTSAQWFKIFSVSIDFTMHKVRER